MQRIVLKLGGSLLHQRDWCPRLLELISKIGDHQYFLIVGGGDVVEAMRKLDQSHALDETAMHWRCVEMLHYTTDIAWEILQRSKRVIPLTRIRDADSFASIANSSSRRIGLNLVESTAFYSRSDQGLQRNTFQPPQPGWRTTTDAIAIYCAALIDADQCILLKSCDIAEYLTISEAVRLRIVDVESKPMCDQYSNVRMLKL